MIAHTNTDLATIALVTITLAKIVVTDIGLMTYVRQIA